MSHIYSIPLQEGDQYDQTHSSYMPYNFFMTTTPLYQERNDGRLLQKEPDEQMMVSGSSDGHGLLLFPNNNNNNNNTVKQSMGDLYLHGCNNKWMSSKMRFIKKMMNSESKPLRNMEVVVQEHSDSINTEKKKNNNNNNNNNSPIGFIRVCSDCNTTKTPLWRSGPRGPKSLCNACGIRQRKARRAMAAAAAANGGFVPTERNNKVRKEKRTDHHVDRTVPFKKRCRNFPHDHSSDQTNACFDEKVTINLSKNASFHRVFPQDERDAAILLMALSCGPIHS